MNKLISSTILKHTLNYYGVTELPRAKGFYSSYQDDVTSPLCWTERDVRLPSSIRRSSSEGDVSLKLFAVAAFYLKALALCIVPPPQAGPSVPLVPSPPSGPPLVPRSSCSPRSSLGLSVPHGLLTSSFLRSSGSSRFFRSPLVSIYRDVRTALKTQLKETLFEDKSYRTLSYDGRSRIGTRRTHKR